MAAAIFAAAADLRAQTNVYSVNVCSFVNLPGPFIDRSWLIGPQSCQIGFQETRRGNSDSYHFTFVHTSANPASSVSHFTSIAMVGVHPIRIWIQPWIAALIIVPTAGLVMAARWRQRNK